MISKSGFGKGPPASSCLQNFGKKGLAAREGLHIKQMGFVTTSATNAQRICGWIRSCIQERSTGTTQLLKCTFSLSVLCKIQIPCLFLIKLKLINIKLTKKNSFSLPQVRLLPSSSLFCLFKNTVHCKLQRNCFQSSFIQ